VDLKDSIIQFCLMDIKQKFGLKIKEIRNAKGLSQEKLAELAHLHRTYISSLELGQRNVSIVNVERLAIALDCELTDLFNFSK
jgi:transcriptional regulator with XRE-family HTH domain